MSEVNGSNFSVNQIPFQGIKNLKQETATEEQTENNETPQITDFSNPKAEALGRSMIFKGTDNIDNDLKALLETPQIAENSDKLFEKAYKLAQDAGLDNPYEEAASASTASM